MTNWDNVEKSGTFEGGYFFNEANMNFNQSLDDDNGNIVFFNGTGQGQVWVNEIKTL